LSSSPSSSLYPQLRFRYSRPGHSFYYPTGFQSRDKRRQNPGTSAGCSPHPPTGNATTCKQHYQYALAEYAHLEKYPTINIFLPPFFFSNYLTTQPLKYQFRRFTLTTPLHSIKSFSPIIMSIVHSTIFNGSPLSHLQPLLILLALSLLHFFPSPFSNRLTTPYRFNTNCSRPLNHFTSSRRSLLIQSLA